MVGLYAGEIAAERTGDDIGRGQSMFVVIVFVFGAISLHKIHQKRSNAAGPEEEFPAYR